MFRRCLGNRAAIGLRPLPVSAILSGKIACDMMQNTHYNQPLIRVTPCYVKAKSPMPGTARFARVSAVDEGRASGIPYDQIKKEISDRLGRR